MENANLEIATLGAGCFWCVEAVFQELRAVEKLRVGYSGGHVENPTYQQVCAKQTGHAEVIQISFDSQQISFADLLEVFWRIHDPTTLNRQGNDAGPQYRSVIFYHNEQQKEIAQQSKAAADLAGIWPDPIVTEISPFLHFYSAEEMHQNFYKHNSYHPYCRFVIDPKLDRFRKGFGDLLDT